MAVPAPVSPTTSPLDDAKGTGLPTAAESKAADDSNYVAVKYVGVPGVYRVRRESVSKATQTDQDHDDAGKPGEAANKVPAPDEAEAGESLKTGSHTAPTRIITNDSPAGLAPLPALTSTPASGAGGTPGDVRAVLDAAFNSFDEFDALALAGLTEGRPLATLGTYLFSRLGLNETFNFNQEKLKAFFSVIEDGVSWREGGAGIHGGLVWRQGGGERGGALTRQEVTEMATPEHHHSSHQYDDGTSTRYHNNAHAASVLHMTHATMHLGGASKMVGSQNFFRPWLNEEGGTLGDGAKGAGAGEEGSFETLACLLAAAIHDFEHMGLSNDYLVATDE